MECKNCHTQLSEVSLYCNQCGGKVIKNRLTLKNLLEYFTETFLNYDNQFLQTFIALFKVPEDVIIGYINGVRKKYVDVISYFAIALTVLGIQYYILSHIFPKAFEMGTLLHRGSEELQKKNFDFMMEYQSLFFMLYIPVHALISRIVFYNVKTFNYTEHLVIFLYLISQSSIYGAIIMVFLAAFGIHYNDISLSVILPLQTIYISYCLIRLFKLNFKQFLFRFLIFLAVGGIFFIIYTLLYIGILYLNGDMHYLFED
ncbi:DUF3667 domain-containing protein [Mangrovimonas sp. DI 80]|uniref:DUF3667 domain-containing protein n=1 Tax=Mangrovimonas sp. DI 80 TaxID=1779330 RepID=UPI0009768429|nr:DUF3667 domain-containing protein [Mangrovimonas sp. DI 80]OMP30485.1 hypothetical protein BKM32_14020 [Mangrovimonas sp. DI 80]